MPHERSFAEREQPLRDLHVRPGLLWDGKLHAVRSQFVVLGRRVQRVPCQCMECTGGELAAKLHVQRRVRARPRHASLHGVFVDTVPRDSDRSLTDMLCVCQRGLDA